MSGRNTFDDESCKVCGDIRRYNNTHECVWCNFNSRKAAISKGIRKHNDECFPYRQGLEDVIPRPYPNESMAMSKVKYEDAGV